MARRAKRGRTRLLRSLALGLAAVSLASQVALGQAVVLEQGVRDGGPAARDLPVLLAQNPQAGRDLRGGGGVQRKRPRGAAPVREPIVQSRAVLPDGVTPEIERTIERGIQFLLDTAYPRSVSARARRGEVFWSGWSRSDGVYRCAMTSLVGLVLLAHGDTVTRGTHAEVVEQITEYLLRCGERERSGLITSGSRTNEQRPMYSHGLAMTFLAQVLGQEGNLERRRRIQAVLERAVTLSQRTQTHDGGWGYVPNDRADEGTLTVTQLQGLRVCRDAGLIVPKSVIDGGVDYIRRSANPQGGVRYRIRDNRVRPGVTCAAVVALWNAGEYDSRLYNSIVHYVNTYLAPPWHRSEGFTRGHHAEYVAYYMAQAKWIQGGQEWKRFYQRVSEYLVATQERDGSWEGADGGQAYGTTMALLVLQMPYDRLPVYQR